MKKKPGRDLFEEFPFKLPCHVIVERKGSPFSKWTVVCTTVHGKKVHRIPEPAARLQPATELSIKEQCRRVIDYGAKPLKTDDVAELSRIAEQALAALAGKARSGDGKALWQFAALTAKAAEGLSQMMHENPEALIPIARHYARWPLMRSTHPRNRDNDDWLSKMKLGRAVPVQLDKFSKWKPGWEAEYAICLFEHLQFLRSENRIVRLSDGTRKPFADFLPPFTKGTAEKWWRLAQSLLLDTYPEPQIVPELDRIADASKREFPSKRRQSILDKIKARFMAMAQY